MKHHEPVAGHLVSAVLRARPEETAFAVLARLRAQKPASVELVLVELKKRAAERGIKLRGREGWELHPSLGVRAPDYGEG